MYADENFKVIPLLKSATDIHTAGANTASVNMENIHSLTIIVTFGNVTVAGPRIQLYSAAAADTSTTAIAKSVKVTGADIEAAAADKFSVTVAPTSGQTYTQPTHTQLAHRTAIMEVKASDLAAGHKWIRVNFGDQSTACTASVVAVAKPRYSPLETATKTA
jgi:hypothetical protein